MRVALTLSGRYATEAAGSGQVVLLPGGWRRLVGVPPRVIAGPLEALERLACEVRTGVRTIPKSIRRVIVYNHSYRRLLDERDRDFLWHAFQLPVFEQVRDPDGVLIAWECDAHSGLHWKAECGIRPPATRVVYGLCACGVRTPRLIPVR
ncbi:MAG TPA: hypothetical protein PLA43_02425 [Bryobacteraceae bacterium]|nr:hypothetical protein [Bryobacteraceae bacterium]HOL72066.1 hypothetical protein [Bryobacteraceae bacterium]HOQ44466.1 hypothetical protein [Bryobacteraceae bacterium]HPQ15479.1 hypothetical protein [Bryobacteraceae bacterium]HPU70785.1 hypothetical protein [Bryobacteraceae bacterium]